MSVSALVGATIARLEAAGYRRVPTPFQVASVRFDFTAVLQGQHGRGTDIVLIVDTSAGDHGDNSGARIHQRVEALSRALDVSRSHLVLTAVLAGAPLRTPDVDALSRLCRVLAVDRIRLDRHGRPATDDAAQELDDRLRILLPLTVEKAQGSVADALGELEKRLPPTVNREVAQKLIAASARGEGAVSKSIAELLEEALKPGVPL
jgi:hypothetical protein